MKTLTRAAVAALLIAGTSGMAIVAPAEAKKKEEKKPGLVLSEAVRTPGVAAQAAMEKKDFAAAGPSVDAVEAAAKTDDERYFAQALRLQLQANMLGSNGNENVLAPTLDALIAGAGTPASELPRFNYMRANIYYNAKQYPQALAAYQRAKDGGYANPNLPLQLARTKITSGDAAGGAADLEALIAADKAAGKPADEEMIKYVITALQKTTDTAATQRWTREWLHSFPTQKNWHTAVYVFGFQGANDKAITKRQRIDLFRLLRQTGSLTGQNEYLEYADLAVETANASEARTVVEEGKAKGKIPAADVHAKETLSDAATQIAQEGTLARQELRARAASDGLEANGTGDFALGSGNYAKAVEMYQLALSKGGAKLDRDEVNTHLGIAYMGTGDKAAAKAAFALVTTGLRGQIATLWTTWADAPGVPTA